MPVLYQHYKKTMQKGRAVKKTAGVNLSNRGSNFDT